jgi:hypothetical protein
MQSIFVLAVALTTLTGCGIFNVVDEQIRLFFDTPEDGAVISLPMFPREKEITITAIDPTGGGVVSVICYVDSGLLGEKDYPPYSWTWIATSEDTGSHTIKVVARDASGNERETVSHVTLIQGTFALQFDGTSGNVVIANDPTLQIVDQLTLEAWIKFDAGGAGRPRLISKDAYELILGSRPGREGVELWIAPSTANANTGPNRVLSAGVWYHIAATYNGAMTFIYIGGIEDSSEPRSGAIATSVGNLFI